jgi:uncharacterized membrane protein YhhN
MGNARNQQGFCRMTFVLLAAAAAFALIYWVRFAGHDEGSHPMAGTAAKTASTALLAAAGTLANAPELIITGLALGAIGDFALSRPGTAAFLAGMAAFAAGHLAYTWAFWTRAADLGFTAPTPGQWVAFAVIIGAMAATVLILPPGAGRKDILLGAGLFLLSDALLALRMFAVTAPKPRLALGLAVWPAYWMGQALILIGSAIYWTFPKV